MNKYVILNNPLDKKSRDFVTANPSYQVINFYEEVPSEEYIEYLSKGLPMVSVFPAVCDTEEKIVANDPIDMEQALQSISDSILLVNVDIVFKAKTKRNDLFGSTKWIQERHKDELEMNVSTTITGSKYIEWLEYWQSLRDMSFSDVNNIVFPNQPE